MESTKLEKLQLEVIRELCLLPRESLVELCDYLIIAGTEFEYMTDKGRTALITLISNHIQRGELEKLEDKGMSELLHLQDKISELQVTWEADTLRQVKEQQKRQDGEEERILEEIEALQLQLASTRKKNENEESRINEKLEAKPSPHSLRRVQSKVLRLTHGTKTLKTLAKLVSPVRKTS